MASSAAKMALSEIAGGEICGEEEERKWRKKAKYENIETAYQWQCGGGDSENGETRHQ
jgi:hypothetical protein